MERRQLVLFGSVFAVIAAVVALVYLVFVRQEFVVLFADIREQDSAEIIAELDQLGLEYRLADGGHAILVPEDSLEEARIAIAGADIAMGGVVGFELFNESDMGLTEFAQQVNYQRAIQGELARTIMMMEGIAFARVHVSLPERSLFQDDELVPQAAVTIQPRPGHVIGAANVAGIQRLVASAIPELATDSVSVLDQHGQLVSRDTAAMSLAAPELDEQTALEAYFRARAREAAAPLLPGVRFDVRVNAIRQSQSSGAAREESSAAGTGDRTAGSRDFALDVALRTEFELAAGDHASIGEQIAQAVALNPANGDTIRFEVADLAATDPALPAPVIAAADIPADGTEAELPAMETGWLEEILFSRWALLILLVIAVIVLPLLRRRSRMSSEQHRSFAEEIEVLLSQREERGHG